MLRSLWNRITGRRHDAAVEYEEERERMSPAERRFVDESVEGHQADEFVGEHLGGVEPDRIRDDDDVPR